MTIGDFLLRRLEEAGVGHLFGVPGDFNLELLQQLDDAGRLKWVGTCHELNASYAADGYAPLAEKMQLPVAATGPAKAVILIDSVMDPLDAPAAVINSSNRGAELDYGPHGSQYRDNAQLRPAT
jgi:glyoxylate carboligase